MAGRPDGLIVNGGMGPTSRSRFRRRRHRRCADGFDGQCRTADPGVAADPARHIAAPSPRREYPDCSIGETCHPPDARGRCAPGDLRSSARGFMFALGCIQSLKCNKNTCPTGITTHDRRLQMGLGSHGQSGAGRQLLSQPSSRRRNVAHSCGVPHVRRLRRFHVRIGRP